MPDYHFVAPNVTDVARQALQAAIATREVSFLKGSEALVVLDDAERIAKERAERHAARARREGR